MKIKEGNRVSLNYFNDYLDNDTIDDIIKLFMRQKIKYLNQLAKLKYKKLHAIFTSIITLILLLLIDSISTVDNTFNINITINDILLFFLVSVLFGMVLYPIHLKVRDAIIQSRIQEADRNMLMFGYLDDYDNYYLKGAKATKKEVDDNYELDVQKHLKNIYIEVRLQSRQSYQMFKISFSIGLIILFISVVLSFFELINTSYITLISGVIVEIMAGVLFIYYNSSSKLLHEYQFSLKDLYKFEQILELCDGMDKQDIKELVIEYLRGNG